MVYDHINTIFVQVTKTASTSIHNLLADERQLTLPMTHLRYNKCVADEAINGNDVSGYYSFSVIRNPYDRYISSYFFMRQIFNWDKSFDENLDELLNLTNKPNFRYLAGGTDLNLQRPIINEDQNTIINLSNIKELKNIEVQNNKLLLGSAVTIENFLVTIKDRIPELIELLQRFGSPQIRNQGTIGGNLCTSSPIGDIAPIFLALNAKLNIFGSNGRKKVNLNEFYTGYRKNILTKDEIVSSIEVPLPKKDYNLFCWKLSKRYDQDISTISLTVYIKIRDQIIDDIHLAAGGIAETPKYLDNLCNDMIGQKLDKSISFAINNIKNYIKPISDIRGTADYRIESFRGLFRRLEKCLIDGVKTMSIMDYNNEFLEKGRKNYCQQ